MSLLTLFSLPFVPAKAEMVLLGIGVFALLFMLYDSYRPITALHWWGWSLLIIVSLTLSELSSIFLHRMFHFSHVPTAAMAPTISPGDYIFVSRSAYWFHPPKRGDIVVFKTSGIAQIGTDPSGKEIMHDKRVVGLPGDRIEILDPEIRINGVEMKFGDQAHPIEYRYRNKGSAVFAGGKETYVVPDGQYFVLGDNSANSFDSRYFGSVPRDAIYGKVVKIYWPWNRMSTPR
ncbi:MAG TPA: signal peptidase I [Chthoniobacterales bacterium]|nr:signal peptidase I [Chthoniobacterales bacterium]